MVFPWTSKIHLVSVFLLFAVAVLPTLTKQESGIIAAPKALDSSSTDCTTGGCRPQLKHKRQAPVCDLVLMDDYNSATRFPTRRNLLGGWQDVGGGMSQARSASGQLQLRSAGSGGFFFSNFAGTGCYNAGSRSVFRFVATPPSAGATFLFEIQIRNADCSVQIARRESWTITLRTAGPQAVAINLLERFTASELTRLQAIAISGFSVLNAPYSFDDFSLACPPTPTTSATSTRITSTSAPTQTTPTQTVPTQTVPTQTATTQTIPTQTPTGTATSVPTGTATSVPTGTTTGTASPTTTPILCPRRVVDDFNNATLFSSNVNVLNGFFGSGNLVMTRTTDGRLSLVPSSGAYWYSNFNRGTCFDATTTPYISFTVNAAAGASFTVEMQVRSADCATQIARRVNWRFTTTGTTQNIVLRLDDPDKLTTAELARLQAIVFVAFTPLSIPYVFDDIRLNSLGPCSSSTTPPSTTTTASPPTPTGTPAQWPMPPFRIGESYTCGAGTVCGNGLCCSSAGFCGVTSEYCGTGCQSQCDKNNFPYFPVRDAYESFSSCAYLRDFSVTYDDGPHPTFTPRLLTALAAARVRTTFFVIGQNVVSNPGTLLATFQAGHHIASHSFTHPDLTTLTVAQLNDEITRTENAIFNVIGRYPKYFRPPYGSINAQVASVLRSRGYRIVMWNFDTKDFETTSSDVVFGSYTSYFGPLDARRNTWISLQHDIQPSSIDAAARIFSYLGTTKGYNLRTVWECLGDTSGYR